MLRFSLDIAKDGMHSIDLHTEGETLIPHFVWHKSVPIHSWTVAKLLAWADAANHEDFLLAEKQFIRASTGEKPREFRS